MRRSRKDILLTDQDDGGADTNENIRGGCTTACGDGGRVGDDGGGGEGWRRLLKGGRLREERLV